MSSYPTLLPLPDAHRALCTRPGADPSDWETLTGTIGAPSPEATLSHLSQAAAVCAGCPILQQCAQWAQAQPHVWLGVIVAGIPFTEDSGTQRLRRKLSYDALAMVASGAPLHLAHAAYMRKVEHLASAQVARARAALAARGGMGPHPTHPGGTYPRPAYTARVASASQRRCEADCEVR